MHALLRWFLLLFATLGLLAGKPPKAPRTPVDLNAATATELMQLPRVGARTAARILAFRKEHGPFRRPEELMNVKGIGEKSFLLLKPHLVVNAPENP
jgi:competence protein ComEA